MSSRLIVGRRKSVTPVDRMRKRRQQDPESADLAPEQDLVAVIRDQVRQRQDELLRPPRRQRPRGPGTGRRRFLLAAGGHAAAVPEA